MVFNREKPEREKPWVLIELKEVKLLRPAAAAKARERLLKLRERLKRKGRPKRAYPVYVARRRVNGTFDGPKGEAARYFFDVPITLEPPWSEARRDDWEEKRRALMKRLGLK
jgi:hypothetical protein